MAGRGAGDGRGFRNRRKVTDKYFSDEDEYLESEKTKNIKSLSILRHKQPHEISTLQYLQRYGRTPSGRALPVDPKRTEKSTQESANSPKKEQPKETTIKEFILTKEKTVSGVSSVSNFSRNVENEDGIDNKLKQVVSLHLQQKGIQTLATDAFKVYKSLAHLFLYDNKITKMQGFSSLPQLESLHLSGNKIKRIEGLENSFNLRQLYLGQNEIEVVEGLNNLTMLLELHIEHQKLPLRVPLIFCPNSLDTISRKIKVLNLSGNQLESIEDLLCLDVLDTLNLSKNKITNLDGISVILRTLRQLRVLDLRENHVITKNPKYKEKIVGFCNAIEILDGKDVNDMQRKTLQRLVSIKAKRSQRSQHQFGRDVLAKPITQQLPLQRSRYPARPKLEMPVLLEGLGQGTTKMIQPQKRPSFPMMGREIKTNSTQFPIMQYSNINLDTVEQFQFTTPISTPTPYGAEESRIEVFNEDEKEKIETRSSPDSLQEDKVLEEIYSVRNKMKFEDEDEPEKMSEMAKIIFHLSNLSPNAEEQSVKAKDALPKYHWDNKPSYGSQDYKESRPLSPLEVESSRTEIYINPNSGRRTSQIRRPVPKKLPPKRTVGAGRILSPLEEMPTPDSTKNGDLFGAGRKLEAAGDIKPLPPWPHIERKKILGPTKVLYK